MNTGFNFMTVSKELHRPASATYRNKNSCQNQPPCTATILYRGTTEDRLFLISHLILMLQLWVLGLLTMCFASYWNTGGNTKEACRPPSFQMTSLSWLEDDEWKKGLGTNQSQVEIQARGNKRLLAARQQSEETRPCCCSSSYTSTFKGFTHKRKEKTCAFVVPTLNCGLFTSTQVIDKSQEANILHIYRQIDEQEQWLFPLFDRLVQILKMAPTWAFCLTIWRNFWHRHQFSGPVVGTVFHLVNGRLWVRTPIPKTTHRLSTP